MSDSILALLADELDTSPEKAQKLLIAMLREVKKRARREGVRLPNFGTFREADGQITFEPAPSLARAVNHRFEGLESEDLGTAPEPATDEAEDDDGPNTITLGYQNSDWTPLGAEADGETDDETDDADDDTEEFQVPAAEEAADTDEFEVPDSAASAPASEPDPPDEDPQTTETEELYPLVEDVPGDADEADARPTDADEDPPGSAADEEHDSLSGIWDDDEEQEAPDQSETEFDPFDAEPGAAASPPASTEDPADTPEPAASDADAPEEIDTQPSDRPPTAPDEKEVDDAARTSGSVGARVGVGLLAVLLLGGAAWYVLGRQGTVQPPRETIAQLTTQLQSQVNTLSSTGASSSTEDAGLETPPSATAEVGTGSAGTEGTSSETSGDAPTAPAPSSSSEEGSPSPGLTPRAGGWTVIVASRTQRGPAESLVEKYRTAFPERRLPIGVLPSKVDGQTRYRVGVGQFDSRSGAQQLLDEAGAKLPQGAWPLRLQ